MTDQIHAPYVEGASDDISTNESGNTPFHVVVERALSRRGFLGGSAALAASSALVGSVGAMVFAKNAEAASLGTLTFESLPHRYDDTHHVANGYDAEMLIRWGDAVVKGAPAFDPTKQSAAAQALQFGYNNDFVGYTPLPYGSGNPARGLLCVTHEYVDRELMFPNAADRDKKTQSKEMVDVEMAAHGFSVIEIARDAKGKWSVVADSAYNRRGHVGTEMKISGPAAGHDRMKTSQDATGTKVLGTLNNCAGSVTPWGTVLMAEENFNNYFSGDITKTKEARAYKRLGIAGDVGYGWYRFHDRFDVEKEPNEANRFGWMVEVDPYDPAAVPVKRTALGRFKHEGAHALVDKSGHVVCYAGDDQQFDYVYKFVSKAKYDAKDRKANFAILDEGTLFVARFNDDKTLDWLPLTFGEGPLTPANDFHSQADVLIETRRAADLLGATPMDRPEDVEPNLVTGVVYAVMTNNTKRKKDQVNAVNPRATNEHGHIVEMIPPGGRGADKDHTATKYGWDLFLLGGDPSKPEQGAKYHPAVGAGDWLSCPDNVAVDGKGRLWIATDGAPKAGMADGVWAADTEGDGRALVKLFFSTPRGAELCGPSFNVDDTAYFAAIQHPADEKGSTYDKPSTRWPDFKPDMPPRPSVMVITKQGGGAIG
ncbi:MAG: PhoX family phosphatase [Siculibacillus sp.]|nr:PhoX family phosphatase [Siculibacillus sp.]